MNISIVIPTYREPLFLDLCLKSAIKGQVNENQIIVVCDGFYEENKEVILKYADKIDVLDLPNNVGLPKATNLGVYNAIHDWILIVNDDNVFPQNWDKSLEGWNYVDERNTYVVAPNQIEPIPSIFKEFIIHDCGRDPNTFNIEQFWKIEKTFKKNSNFNGLGGTLPIFMRKKDFMKVGGWDDNYPTTGVVSDWDFFHKCKISGMQLTRDYNLNFYHFVSAATTPTVEQIQRRQQQEHDGHEYGRYKWGKYLKHNLLI